MTPVHPEGPRYAAPLVFVPGLWCGPKSWRGPAGALAHRGWQGWLAARGGEGGVAARARELASAVAVLEQPPVLIGHDGGGLVALAAAQTIPVSAVVWVAPIVPGDRTLRRLVSPWHVLRALVSGAPVPRPAAWDPATPGSEASEAAAVVVDVVRARVRPVMPRAPLLLLAGDADPRLHAAAHRALATALAADTCVVAGAGSSPFASPAWQEVVDRLHRWLVQRLGAGMLELYEEAMAERDADDGA